MGRYIGLGQLLCS